MITGDKQETAINIAVACRLVHHADALLVANEDRSAEAAEALLRDLIAQARQRNAAEVRTGMLPARTCHHGVCGTGSMSRLRACLYLCSCCMEDGHMLRCALLWPVESILAEPAVPAPLGALATSSMSARRRSGFAP